MKRETQREGRKRERDERWMGVQSFFNPEKRKVTIMDASPTSPGNIDSTEEHGSGDKSHNRWTEKGPHKPKYPHRLQGIDILRGISILLMVVAHVGTYWLRGEDQWLVALYFLVVNVHGTNGFTFVAGMGFGYSWMREMQETLKRRQQDENIKRRQKDENVKRTQKDESIKRGQKGLPTRANQSPQANMPKSQARKSLEHSLLLLGLSILYNVGSALVRGSPRWFEYIWYWNILQTIAVCRIVAWAMIRVPKRWRVAIILALILGTPWITEWVAPNREFSPLQSPTTQQALFFYLFYNPLYADGLLFFLPFFLTGTIVGEFLADLKKGPLNNQHPFRHHHKRFFRKWTILGAVICLAGVALGLENQTGDYGWNLLALINLHPKINWQGLPAFLVANSWQWIIYSIGFELFLSGLLLYRVDFQQTQRKRQWGQGLILKLYGKYSLTVYLEHYLLLFLPFLQNAFSASTIWIPLFLFVLIVAGYTRWLDQEKRQRWTIEYYFRKILQSR